MANYKSVSSHYLFKTNNDRCGAAACVGGKLLSFSHRFNIHFTHSTQPTNDTVNVALTSIL